MVIYLKNIKLTSLLIAVLLLVGCFDNDKKMNNLDIIKSTYEGKNSEENGKNLQKYLANNVTWTEAKGFPYAGTYIGFEEISLNVFSKLGSEWINYKFTPEDYIANDTKVAVYGTYTGIYKKTNKAFTSRVTHIWKLKKGQIISFEQFVDSKPIIDIMK